MVRLDQITTFQRGVDHLFEQGRFARAGRTRDQDPVRHCVHQAGQVVMESGRGNGTSEKVTYAPHIGGDGAVAEKTGDRRGRVLVSPAVVELLLADVGGDLVDVSCSCQQAIGAPECS